ncbi:hypothetical protein MNF30_02995 [Mycoplasma mycoides subsp. capri]|uniref:hypothetical protein n=1 Tax=Mycoplasma mycoides TaxID=2102 RepID=UPI00223FB97A|nr:hypothetical protein [Mycoplasma mycoides]UZK63908.1 hypothetical protein MNF30_02995 [Mycoplasma mycoides subsp. capri]
MKKYISILSCLTILSSSLVVISCKYADSNIKNNEKQNNINKENNSKKDETSKSLSNEKITFDKNPTSSNNLSNQNRSVDELKEIKEKVSPEIKQKIQDIETIIKNKQDQLINNLTNELVYKYLLNSFAKEIDKKIVELNTKILKLFDESNLDDIKIKINSLFSESLDDKQKVTDKEKQEITNLLKDVKLENKDKILEKINALLIKISTSEFNKKQEKITNEINQLLLQKEYEQVKKRLIDLLIFSVNSKKIMN